MLDGFLKLRTTGRLLIKRISRIPLLRYPISRTWNTYEYARFTYAVRKNLRSENYDATIDPFCLYWISPDDVEYFSGGSFDFITDTGTTAAGSWDLDTGPCIKEYSSYRSFKQRFCEEVPWRQTEFYSQLAKKIHDGRATRYATISELAEKCKLYDNIYDRFKNGEYQLQSDVVDEDNTTLPGDGGRAFFPSITDQTLLRHEIAIDIGRNGRLFLNEGRNRLSLAKIADIDRIPVRIVVRHENWQTLRDQIARILDDARESEKDKQTLQAQVTTRLEDELEDVDQGINHPDLQVLFDRRFDDE